MCNAFYCRVQKSIFSNTKSAIFGDKYLSQDLIVILRNVTQLCQVKQRGVGEGGEPSPTDCWRTRTPTQLSRGIDPMLFLCCADVEDGGPALEQHWVHASCLLG